MAPRRRRPTQKWRRRVVSDEEDTAESSNTSSDEQPPPKKPRFETKPQPSSSGPSTRSRQTAVTSNQDKAIVEVSDDDELLLTSPVKNTASSSRSGTKNSAIPKRTALDCLPSMPLDILYEIFRHLTPKDLLHLARSSNAFRGLLLDRSWATLLWVNARSNVPTGLPACPSHLSEPCYASLIFDSVCQNCYQREVQDDHVVWELGSRLCRNCLVQLTEHHWNPFEADIKDLNWTTLYTYFYKSDHREFVRELAKLGGTARQKYLDQCAREAQEKITHAENLRTWVAEMARLRRQEMEAAKQRRLNDIETRLHTLGWGRDLQFIQREYDYHRQFQNVPGVSTAEDLTEEDWELISPAIVAFMQSIKEIRLAAELRAATTERLRLLDQLLESHHSKQQLKKPFPQTIDFCSLPMFRDVIDVPTAVELADVELGLLDLEPTLPALIDSWETTRAGELLKLIPSDFLPKRTKKSTRNVVNMLDLAVAIFQCQKCAEIRAYPSVMVHRCQYSERSSRPDNVPRRDHNHKKTSSLANLEYETTAISALRSHFWSPSSLQWNPWLPKVSVVVKVCGLDPKSATTGDMDKLDARFNCAICSAGSKGKKIEVMDWRTAMDHCIHRHTRVDLEDMELVLLGNRETKVAKHAERSLDTLGKDSPSDQDKIWCCCHCAELVGQYQTVWDATQHVRHYHNVNRPKRGEDFAPHPGAELDQPPPLRTTILLISKETPYFQLLPADKQALAVGRACYHQFKK
ncbi:hypothetical protein JAAARDRAFT_465990 [Jaapia argillacea MUCL 33604]|uniref:F-box domain-containing protein n=1 Tax=Jaapia argillacea MUCL 33604 TaxID=933084 RepID=A0A067Q8U8_9AGAM|nr:hypothetical protein JAAARDRAFT_465990 [Jaapia argillacea MUCL 33604]